MNFENEVKEFESKLKELMEKYSLPGLSVAITHENKLIYSGGLGFADMEKKIKATATTPYRIASLTKPIASTIILQLVEKELIDLDKSIAEYIPNYIEFCEKNKKNLEKPVDIGGKKIDLSFLIKYYHYENQNITIRHHLQQTINGEPGEIYCYNGLLYGLLGLAVDFTIEEKFRGILQREIIDKLEMNDSLTHQEDESKPEILKRLAKPYVLNEKKKLVLSKYPQKNGSSSAGIVSTVLDLVKFDNAINNNELISEESKELAFTNPKNSKGEILPYGLGWFVQKEMQTNNKLIWHYGHWDNSFSSLYIKIPEKDLTLIILANSDGLSKDFNLHEGNLYKSPFAKAFLSNF
ncbi:MAG: beta-lactamase family protein [Asgard group archaeon]|nr:beta-lactamase family protein [Asgard group archaeon]